MNISKTLIATVLIIAVNPLFGQVQPDTVTHRFTLQDVINMAITQSSAIKYVQNRNVNYYWRYRNYKTRFRPQLLLTGDLPDYRHTTRAITQPDGSIEFRQISNLEISSRLSVQQSIPQIGTSIYASTSSIGIRNLKNNETRYSGSPFSIGFTQPLFAYNWMKWYRKTEPMIYDEAQKRFVEDIEEIALYTTYRYFRYLGVQTNYNLAQSNLENSKDNLKISQTKKQLGQISEND
ncbi:MAG: TolC family protein, partial [Prolixibacteraceae bacterium]